MCSSWYNNGVTHHEVTRFAVYSIPLFTSFFLGGGICYSDIVQSLCLYTEI